MPAASDPSAALGIPSAGEDRRSLLSPGFVLVTAATLFYFVALGALLPTLPVYVEDELGGGSVAVGVTSSSPSPPHRCARWQGGWATPEVDASGHRRLVGHGPVGLAYTSSTALLWLRCDS